MRKFFLSTALVLLVSLMVASPVRAQEQTGFSRFFRDLQSQLQRLYLQLPGEKSGQAVIEQMVVAMETVETARYAGTIHVEAVPDEAPPLAAQLEAEGVMSIPEWVDIATWQQQAAFRTTLTSEQVTLMANGTLIQDGLTHYLLFSDVPLLPLINTSRLRGTWIRLESAEETAFTTEERTDAEKQELRQATVELLQSANFSSARREAVEGYPVFVVEVTLPEDAVRQYARRVSESRLAESADTDRQEVLRQMDEWLAAIGPITSTLFIDRNTYYLRRAMVPLQLPLSQLSGVGQTGVVRIDSDTSFRDFNQPVVIDVPIESRPWSEVMAEVLPAEGGVFTFENFQDDLVEREGESETPAELAE